MNTIFNEIAHGLFVIRTGTESAYYGPSKFNLFYRGIIAGRIERRLVSQQFL